MVEFNAIKAEKDKIRKKILERLHSQSSFERIRKSAEIKEALFKMSAFQLSKSIMFYISKDYEVETDTMIIDALKLKKRIIVPVTSVREKKMIPSELKDFEGELEKGPFGIRQPKPEYIKPVPTENIDIVIVPGVAFDKSGNRIGHGAGYYDTFLSTLPVPTLTIGLAFDFQIIGKVPTLTWDVSVKKTISA